MAESFMRRDEVECHEMRRVSSSPSHSAGTITKFTIIVTVG